MWPSPVLFALKVKKTDKRKDMGTMVEYLIMPPQMVPL